MKKILIKLGAVLSILTSLLIVARIVGFYEVYTIPTTSNEPGMHPGDIYFATPLIEAEKGDFIAFCCKNFLSNKKQEVYVSRLRAVTGDTVEVRKGDFFLNGQNKDAGQALGAAYLVNSKRLQKIHPDSLLGEPQSVTELSTYRE